MTDFWFCLLKGNQESDEKYVQGFSDQVEATIKKILYAIQTLEEKTTGKKMEETIKKEEGGKMFSVHHSCIVKIVYRKCIADLSIMSFMTTIYVEWFRKSLDTTFEG